MIRCSLWKLRLSTRCVNSTCRLGSANSAKAPIEASELRTSSGEVARLKETIDRLLVEQQRLALRVEDFERTQSDLDLVYVGTENDVIMIEGAANEVPEADFVKALEFAHDAEVGM